MRNEAGGRYVVLYDGECGLCDAGMRWLRARDRWGRFEFLPYQAPERRHRFPALEDRALAEAMHVVAPDGVVRAGADAAPWIFANLPGWSLLARVLSLPGIRSLARPVYRFVAQRRKLFHSNSACARRIH